jgi:predicted NBD/HSP70 family sugar kinase
MSCAPASYLGTGLEKKADQKRLSKKPLLNKVHIIGSPQHPFFPKPMLGIKTAALPASLRRTNQRTVISLLLRMGSASRADLAKAAGISQPTAGKITTELLELGVLQAVGPSSASDSVGGANARRLGRPGQLLRLDEERRRFLTVQLGVVETSVAALPVAVKSEDQWTHRFATPGSPPAWSDALRRVARQFPAEDFWGVLISVPGIVNEGEGRVVFSPNLHWLETVRLGHLVQEELGLPTLLTQEIRALALGHLVAEPVREDFFLVDFGQGVGGAIVLDGQLYPHPTPLSGEFGHTPLPGNLRPCGCGAVGCLETLVSRRGLLESFAARQGERPRRGGNGGSRPETVRGAPVWSDLIQHVNQHGLESWLTDTLDATARVIAGGLNVMGIHRVVITGSLTEFPGSVVEHLSQEIKRGAMWARFGEVACEAAVRRRSSGLVAVGIDRLVLPAGDENDAHLSTLSGSPTARKNLSPVIG